MDQSAQGTKTVRHHPFRRGQAPLGCIVFASMISFIAILAILSGYFYYRNFGAKLRLAHDEILPVGKRFIESLDQKGFAVAYGLLLPECREEWNQEKFADMARDLEEKRGALREVQVDADRMRQAIEASPADEPLVEVPMDFPTIHVRGDARFEMTFRKSDDGWRIKRLKVIIDEPKRDKPTTRGETKPRDT